MRNHSYITRKGYQLQLDAFACQSLLYITYPRQAVVKVENDASSQSMWIFTDEGGREARRERQVGQGEDRKGCRREDMEVRAEQGHSSLFSQDAVTFGQRMFPVSPR